jgi:hypothetical protein
MWCVVSLVAGVAAFTLVLPLLSPLLPFRESLPKTTAHWAVVLAPCSVVILLILLYGQGTTCPHCRKWWALTKLESEFVDRKVFDKGGVPYAKSLYRTTYQCAACRRRWFVLQADEYRESTRRCEKLHRG